jgi:hypothetical protein
MLTGLRDRGLEQYQDGNQTSTEKANQKAILTAFQTAIGVTSKARSATDE